MEGIVHFGQRRGSHLFCARELLLAKGQSGVSNFLSLPRGKAAFAFF